MIRHQGTALEAPINVLLFICVCAGEREGKKKRLCPIELEGKTAK